MVKGVMKILTMGMVLLKGDDLDGGGHDALGGGDAHPDANTQLSVNNTFSINNATRGRDDNEGDGCATSEDAHSTLEGRVMKTPRC